MISVPVLVLPHGEGLALPAHATPGSAGMDVRAALADPVILAPGQRVLVPCGIALAIPEGWEGQVRPRSGLAWRHGVTVLNSPGTIDSDYRGELQVPLVNLGEAPFTVSRGDRIAQIVFAPVAAAVLSPVDALPPTASRHAAGFGSTGRS